MEGKKQKKKNKKKKKKQDAITEINKINYTLVCNFPWKYLKYIPVIENKIRSTNKNNNLVPLWWE